MGERALSRKGSNGKEPASHPAGQRNFGQISGSKLRLLGLMPSRRMSPRAQGRSLSLSSVFAPSGFFALSQAATLESLRVPRASSGQCRCAGFSACPRTL